MDTNIVKGLRGVRLDRVFDALDGAQTRKPRSKRRRPALVLRFLPTV